MNSVKNGEECNFYKTMWFEGGLKLADILTKNVREDELNPILGYSMLILDKWKNACKRGETGYIRVQRKMCYEWPDWIELRTIINEFEMFIWV